GQPGTISRAWGRRFVRCLPLFLPVRLPQAPRLRLSRKTRRRIHRPTLLQRPLRLPAARTSPPSLLWALQANTTPVGHALFQTSSSPTNRSSFRRPFWSIRRASTSSSTTTSSKSAYKTPLSLRSKTTWTLPYSVITRGSPTPVCSMPRTAALALLRLEYHIPHLPPSLFHSCSSLRT